LPATIWSALAHRYVAGQFEVPQGGRQVALVCDAELDEGAIWEALVDQLVARLGELLGSSTSTASRSIASCPRSPPDA
jgi:pyruvate dehydrogenase E1 component